MIPYGALDKLALNNNAPKFLLPLNNTRRADQKPEPKNPVSLPKSLSRARAMAR